VAAGNLKELNSESSGINVEAVVLDGPTANAGGAMAPVPMVPPEELHSKNHDGKRAPIGPSTTPPLEELILRAPQLEKLAGNCDKAKDTVHKDGLAQIHDEAKMFTAAAKTDFDQVYRGLAEQMAVHKAGLDRINRANMEQLLEQ
ncbi:unnamed protein product, partial [Prorocentrum cordatum]